MTILEEIRASAKKCEKETDIAWLMRRIAILRQFQLEIEEQLWNIEFETNKIKENR